MRVLSVVGARPQFIKAAVLSPELAKRGVDEWIVHTGQHYDDDMSDVFFRELRIPQPRLNLGVGSGSHAQQTAEMMRRLEPIVEDSRPDWLVVYGDTNSTLAGALVGAKSGVRVAHVEAGLRSFNRSMPEEINRIVTDAVSDTLFAPTDRAADQLWHEGCQGRVVVVGDLMVDFAVATVTKLPALPAVLERFELIPGEYAVATIHRAGNTDEVECFARLIAGLRSIEMPVVFPVHPRTSPLASVLRVGEADNIRMCAPLGYLEMLALLRYARVVLTDSGGVQKEAVTLGVPVVTLREETEWVETLEEGWNVLAGSDPIAIATAAKRPIPSRSIHPFGIGASATRIADILCRSEASSDSRRDEIWESIGGRRL
jgi:UDP-GlcNAc3NAcA epimerase